MSDNHETAQGSIERGEIREGRFVGQAELRIMGKFGLDRVARLEQMIAETVERLECSVTEAVAYLDSHNSSTIEPIEQTL